MDFLQQFYYGEESSAKIDRIIFVASARSKELPRELITALISQAMGGKRGNRFDSLCYQYWCNILTFHMSHV